VTKPPDYRVIDLEVDNYNSKLHTPCPIGNNPGSPFDPRNKIVCTVVAHSGTAEVHWPTPDQWPIIEAIKVGHNLKFDLLHLAMYFIGTGCELGDVLAWLMKHRVWDTMLAEYILTGQHSTMVSLDQVSAKYGGTLKDDKVKQAWANGYLTSQIPKDTLEEYAAHDGTNTEKVFLAQYAEAERLGMLPLMESQMKALVATTVMEFNGMAFDKPQALAAIQEGEKELETLLKTLNSHMGWKDANCMSNKQIGTFMFGGTVEHKVDKLQFNVDGSPLLYKSGMKKGKQKTKKETKATVVKAKFQCEDEWRNKTGFKTDDSTLKILRNIADTRGEQATVDFITDLLTARKIKKDVSTYYIGYSNLTWGDGYIHPNINHCITATGRLSCSNPNLQNASSKED
jgi:DNA polymerase I-like protein with 3'-5' exonuclease and polymerase domains